MSGKIESFVRALIASKCEPLVLPPSLSLSVSLNGTSIIYGKTPSERTLYATLSNNGGRGFGDIAVSPNLDSVTTRCDSSPCKIGTFLPYIT